MRIRHLAAVLCVAALAAACSGDNDNTFWPSAPSEPTPPPAPVSPTVREITLGETINADIAVAGPPCTTHTNGGSVPCHYYAFTPSADGTVTATLTWDPVLTDTVLLLRIENTQIEPSGPPWSPLTGEVSVRAGQRYSLQVGIAGTGEEAPKPYVLTTALK